MKSAAIRDKHIRLDQRKIERSKTILNAKTETEAIEKALELVVDGNAVAIKRKEVMKSILARRDRLGHCDVNCGGDGRSSGGTIDLYLIAKSSGNDKLHLEQKWRIINRQYLLWMTTGSLPSFIRRFLLTEVITSLQPQPVRRR